MRSRCSLPGPDQYRLLQVIRWARFFGFFHISGDEKLLHDGLIFQQRSSQGGELTGGPLEPDAFSDVYSRFSTLGTTTVPSGRSTTKNICRIGPLTVSEKKTNQNGTGVVRNSCVSSAPISVRG